MVAAGKIVSFFTPQIFFTFGTRVLGFFFGKRLVSQERRQLAANSSRADGAPPEPGAPSP